MLNLLQSEFDQLYNYIIKNEFTSAFDLMLDSLESSGTKWEKEIILLYSKFNDISSSIRNGTVSFSEANVEKNKLRYSLLELIGELHQEVVKRNYQKVGHSHNLDGLTETIEISETIYKYSKEILLENQRVLIPILQSSEIEQDRKLKVELIREMTNIFYGHSKRGDLKRFQSYFRIIAPTTDGDLGNMVNRMLSALGELITLLYSKDDEIVQNLEQSHDLRIRPVKHLFTRTQLNSFSVEAVKEIVIKYLDGLSSLVDEFGIITEYIKRIK